MKFWYLLLVLITLGSSLEAHKITNTIPIPTKTTLEDFCNLPAPTNLVCTVVGVTNLSFAWNAVGGASGYDVALTKVANNNIVYSQSNLAATSINISSLEAGTVYRFEVWSKCGGQERGGQAKVEVTTYDFIIDELASGYNGSPLQQNPYDLFPGSYNQELAVNFQIETPQNIVNQFRVRNLPQAVNGYVHLEHENGNSSPLQIVSHICANPLENNNSVPSFQKALVYTTNNPAKCTDPVLEIRIVKENSMYKLYWAEANHSGYTVKILQQLGRSSMGVINNPKNELQSQDGINGIEERNELNSSTPFAIWPNPFSDLLYIQGTTPAHVQLFDINGKLIYQYSMNTTETNTTIPTADLAKGVYLVRYETADSVKTIKVVKTN